MEIPAAVPENVLAAMLQAQLNSVPMRSGALTVSAPEGEVIGIKEANIGSEDEERSESSHDKECEERAEIVLRKPSGKSGSSSKPRGVVNGKVVVPRAKSSNEAPVGVGSIPFSQLSIGKTHQLGSGWVVRVNLTPTGYKIPTWTSPPPSVQTFRSELKAKTWASENGVTFYT